MEKYVQKLIDLLVNFSGKLILAIVILFVGFKLIKFFLGRLSRGKGFNKLEKTSQTFILSILNVTLKIMISIIAVTTVGIPVASVVTILGSAGLALGLALQGGLSNIAGGVMIMVFKPFKVGDFIQVGNETGTVKEINIFHTILDTVDDRLVVLPNGNLSNSMIINYSSLKNRKLDLRISASYDSDIDKVKKVLYKVWKESEYTIKEEEPVIALFEHAESALVFIFRAPVKTKDFWDAKFDVLERIKKAFDKEKITIPFPQMDVHFDK